MLVAFEEHAITLQDGRQLAYSRFGDPDGKPLIILHGAGSPQGSFSPHTHIAEELGLNVIAPHRPGIGRSDFQPQRQLLDMSGDIAQLADALGFQRFGLAGISAGGPYACACFYAMPERVQGAGMIVASAPLDCPGLEYTPFMRQARFAVRRSPDRLLRFVLWVQTALENRNIKRAFDRDVASRPPADQAILSDPAIRAHRIRYWREATRGGMRGVVEEGRVIFNSQAGFKLEAIRVPVHLWYWEDDSRIPISAAHYLDEHIPHTIPHFFLAGGHASFLIHWREILDAARCT